MSQSVKLSDGSYLDSTGVYDTSLGMTQQAINATLQKKPTYGSTGPISYTVAAASSGEIDTANTITVPKGLNIITATVTAENSGWTSYPYCHFKVAAKNSKTNDNWNSRLNYPLQFIFLTSPRGANYSDWWHAGEAVGWQYFSVDTELSIYFWAPAGLTFKWEINYINFPT